MNATKSTPKLSQQASAALQCVAALAEAIQSLGSVPSGHLYIQVMGVLTMDQYNGAIGLLKRAGLVTEAGHVLTWVGPTLAKGGA